MKAGDGQTALVSVLRSALQRAGAGDWEIELEDIWCTASPKSYGMPTQGWKLHLAATGASAASTLARAVPTLIGERCAFKFASSRAHAELLNSAHYPLGYAGKFLTAYPLDVEHFRRVADELDRATQGLRGPRILSDRALRPGGIVHYRYGGFTTRDWLGNDGQYVSRIRTPAGHWVEDRREPGFALPPGVAPPFPEARAGRPEEPAPLLMDRFRVGAALRQANRGGVYRARDTWTGEEVVLKEARPHVEAREDGWDVQQALRHEARMLDALAPRRITPRTIELFEEGGHLFLAEEFLSGPTFADWVAERSETRPGVSPPAAIGMLRRLSSLIRAAHESRIALRDLSPLNLIIASDDTPRVIDLELAAPFERHAIAGGTPGYVAPEQLGGARASACADLFSLGCLAFVLATGRSAAFTEDDAPVRPHGERLGTWLSLVAPDSGAARALEPLILGLTCSDPEQRWDLIQVERFLDASSDTAAAGGRHRPAAARADGGRRRLSPREQDLLIEDALAQLLAWLQPEDPWRAWPVGTTGHASDPCNVMHGAAGVVAVLARALTARPQASLGAALSSASSWLEKAVSREPRCLPGLLLGRSGTAWALHDAACALGDPALAARAQTLARRLPLRWPNADLALGAAGAGMTQLRLWQATGDPSWSRRVEACADALVERAHSDSDGVRWTVPDDFDSRFAGRSEDGYPHGATGIAWFLLAAGAALGRDDWIALAQRAGRALPMPATSAASQRGRGDAADGRTLHGAYGAAGVASFLLRLWQVTGDVDARARAEEVARAVCASWWHAAPGYCDGLAGDGALLLDLADATGEPRYRAAATEIAVGTLALCARRAGRWVVPTGFGEVVADYGIGIAGTLDFLLRLRHGGERLWAADSVRTSHDAGIPRSGRGLAPL